MAHESAEVIRVGDLPLTSVDESVGLAERKKKYQAHCKHLHPIKHSEAAETVTIVFILITAITN